MKQIPVIANRLPLNDSINAAEISRFSLREETLLGNFNFLSMGQGGGGS